MTPPSPIRPRRSVRFSTKLRTAAAVTAPQPRTCGAVTRLGTPCPRPRGFNTDHVGTGACWQHETTPTFASIQRYRQIEQPAIRRRLEVMASLDEDILDLIPDIQLIRTLVVQYAADFDEFHDALLAWYREGKKRPPRAYQLADVINYIEIISRIIERIHKIRSTGSVSLDTFRRVIEQMGIVVARHVTNGQALDRIEQEWSTLALDARSASSVAALPAASLEATVAGTTPATLSPRARRSRRRAHTPTPPPDTSAARDVDADPDADSA